MHEKFVGPLVCLMSMTATLATLHLPFSQEPPPQPTCPQPTPSPPDCKTETGCRYDNECAERRARILDKTREVTHCCIQKDDGYCDQWEGRKACCVINDQAVWKDECRWVNLYPNKKCKRSTGKCE